MGIVADDSSASFEAARPCAMHQEIQVSDLKRKYCNTKTLMFPKSVFTLALFVVYMTISPTTVEVVAAPSRRPGGTEGPGSHSCGPGESINWHRHSRGCSTAPCLEIQQNFQL